MPRDYEDTQMLRVSPLLRHEIGVRGETGLRQPSHPTALFGFTRYLPAEMRVCLSVSIDPKSDTQPVRMAAWLEGSMDADRVKALAGDFRQALQLAFPGQIVLASEEPRDVLLKPIALPAIRCDEARYLEAAGVVKHSRMPTPTTVLPDSDCVDLPMPGVRPVPISLVLQAVAAARQAARLLISLRPIQLEAYALRQISATLERIQDNLSDTFLPAPERMAMLMARVRLQEWLDCSSGVDAALHLDAADPLSPGLIEALMTAAHGRPADTSGCTPNGGGIDLSMAWPLSGSPRLVLPGPIGLQRVLGATSQHSDSRESRSGVTVGIAEAGQTVNLPDIARSQHVYLCGATGTGKSALIRRMVRDDIRRGFGVGVIDPHGDLVEDLIQDLLGTEEKALDRVVLADLSVAETDFRLNLLENSGQAPTHHANFVANQLIMAFKRILYGDVPEAFGPMFESYFRNALILLMIGSKGPPHLGDFDRVFTDRGFRQQLLAQCPDGSVRRFWTDLAAKVTHHEISLENIAPYIVSKLTQFMGNPVLAPILCTPRSSVNFHDVMQTGGIFLANLAKGTIGETDSRLTGALLSAKIFAAAMRRARLPRAERRPFRLYLDEFQSYSSDLIADMLAESRKFGLELTLANQSLSQIDGRNRGNDVAHAVLANSGTVLAFRTSPAGAPLMAEWIGENTTARDLVGLPNYNVVGRLPTAEGVPLTRRFRTLPE